MISHVTHLECANCLARYDAKLVHGLCTRCQRPLWVRYDLDAVRQTVSRDALASRPQTMWRYHELLPVADLGNLVSLEECVTPLLPAPRLAARFGVDELLVKDESRLPTGSFKARGMAMAITKAREFGITRVAAPTAGNAGGCDGGLCRTRGHGGLRFHAAGHAHHQREGMLARRRQDFLRQWLDQ